MAWPQVVLISWIALFVISVSVLERAQAAHSSEQRTAASQMLWPAALFLSGSLVALFSVALGWTMIERFATVLSRVL